MDTKTIKEKFNNMQVREEKSWTGFTSTGVGAQKGKKISLSYVHACMMNVFLRAVMSDLHTMEVLHEKACQYH